MKELKEQIEDRQQQRR
jgi:hypothetical protein